ncbi:hypothetical protein KCU90_g2369, partial [Aureobasidium melanogenum]
MQRIQLRGIRFQITTLSHPKKRPEHGFHRLAETALAWRAAVIAHYSSSFARGANRQAGLAVVAAVLAVGDALPAVAAAGVFNSKNVYDNVIVFTSFGNFGSTTNTTGIRFV